MSQMTKCDQPGKPTDNFYLQFRSADGFDNYSNAAGNPACPCDTWDLWHRCLCPGKSTGHRSADGFDNASGSYTGCGPNQVQLSNGLCIGKGHSAASLSNSWGGFSNIVGPLGLGSGCGARPIGIGKAHKAKLDAWNTCMTQAKAREAQKKQVKIDAKQADAMSNAALAGALSAPPPAGGDGASARSDGSGNPISGGISMGAKIAIGSLIGLVMIGGTFAIVGMMKKKKKAK